MTPGEVWHACHFSAVTCALHNGEVVGAPRGNRLEHLQTTRETIRDAAMDLFEAVGFADTTAQAIAERAGVSLRTFFRYFDCKEATLFGADLQDWSLRYIEERPRSESLVESLHETGLALWQAGAGEGERRRRLRRALMDEHPSIRAYGRQLLHDIEPRVAEVVARRLQCNFDDLRPQVFAGIWTALVTFLFEHYDAAHDARELAGLWVASAQSLLGDP